MKASDGRKDDSEKPRTDLLFPRALLATARVLAFGARKYGAENWRQVPDLQRRYYGAALRHLFAWATGEQNDPETGEPHLAHAMCCVGFLLEDSATPKTKGTP